MSTIQSIKIRLGELSEERDTLHQMIEEDNDSGLDEVLDDVEAQIGHWERKLQSAQSMEPTA